MTRTLQAMAGAKHGGAEAFFERLAIALDRAGEEQKLVIRHDPERVARLRQAGLDPAELPFGGLFDFATKPQLAQIIAAFRPRVVLTWMNRATRLCPRGDFVHVARLGGYYDLRYYRDCDHLIGNPVAEPVARASLDTPAGVPLALALGRLHPNKAFNTLLPAVARVKGLHLWLAGEGPLAADLKRLTALLRIEDRVRFLGWRDDVGGLLAACDMLVCASRIEPLGNTIIEAWAARKPVVAAASSGPAELIADGKNGLLVPIGDVGALAAAMERLVSDSALAGALAASGREAFDAQFSEARGVAAYREFLATVAR
jgi:glycosyltransferase involved in cell wall biosynthesis